MVDATDTIVMPGFVDTHRHAWESLSGTSERAGGRRDLGVGRRYGDHYKPEDVYAATLIGLLGAAEAGITSVVDWSDIQLDDSLRTPLSRPTPMPGCAPCSSTPSAADGDR